jgi:hypothetical protein
LHVTIHYPDVWTDQLEGGWWTFGDDLRCRIRKGVFSKTPHKMTYVCSLDITPPEHLQSPGTLCVNPKYGLHLNLVLPVPAHLLQRLEDYLGMLNRKIHRAAAKAAGRKPPLQIPGIRQRDSGAAVFIQEVRADKGGPVPLVAGYFADQLDRSLPIAKKLRPPLPKGSQLAFASADIREAAEDLYGRLKASAIRPRSAKGKAIGPASAVSSAAACHSASTPGLSAAAGDPMAELDALLQALENPQPATQPDRHPANSEPVQDLHRGSDTATCSPSFGRLDDDGPAAGPGRPLEQPAAAFRQASSAMRPASLPGPFQGSQTRPRSSFVFVLAGLGNAPGGRADWVLAKPRAGPWQPGTQVISGSF